jgi:hypothetical protein
MTSNSQFDLESSPDSIVTVLPVVNVVESCVGQFFEFAKLLIFLKTCLVGGLAASSQTVGSLLIPPGRQSWLGK